MMFSRANTLTCSCIDIYIYFFLVYYFKQPVIPMYKMTHFYFTSLFVRSILSLVPMAYIRLITGLHLTVS